MTHGELIITLVGAIFASGGFWELLRYFLTKRSASSKLLMGIAYREIVELAEKYIAKGRLTTDEYHELKHYLVEPYKARGGNGTVDKLMLQVDALPIREE